MLQLRIPFFHKDGTPTSSAYNIKSPLFSFLANQFLLAIHDGLHLPRRVDVLFLLNPQLFRDILERIIYSPSPGHLTGRWTSRKSMRLIQHLIPKILQYRHLMLPIHCTELIEVVGALTKFVPDHTTKERGLRFLKAKEGNASGGN